MRLTWAQPEDLVAHEFVALAEQGVDAGSLAAVAARWEQAGGSLHPERAGAGSDPAGPELRARARAVLDELADLAPDSPDEPDDWDAIAALLTAQRGPGARVAEADRVAGAWFGRCAGCLLGKPVEKLPREGIEEIARATGTWPVTGYFTARGLPQDVAVRWPWNRRSAPTSLVENIDGMPEDDDLNFPLLALDLLEAHGPGLTTEDVAQAWLANLPAGRVFTAERAAYRNLLEARPVPETATHHNPFREWIGALIRADVYGWAHPGDPLAAARLAWVDARLSHTRNGLYGAMWAAALCSASLVAGSVDEVLDAGESVLPPRSRLLAVVRRGRELGASMRAGDLTDAGALDALHTEFGHLHWVHTLNNAALIACALAAAGADGGFGRFGHGIALAVTAGWDTDSAGATVGSVLGALHGRDGIEAAWTDPLHGRLATSLPGPPERSLAGLAERTRALPDRMRA
ncbi:ADP-ribosylglycohydrolase family protein [Occultella glacieicola]|uniref:ADP-ribosylglycohydrolase family protein n=1 Tax=Occultella glacieicola TaxID=2518684 RepID=A0ABY2EAZ6_9MICO|nr:ADP-ribosylglycohydrolase family protein [Occultella glacieicola]TDE99126.1 ADP-ribosylglycohydrolase family protein [Occultella glacieicola]